jgi:ATP-dependent protease ClpP protease subunit
MRTKSKNKIGRYELSNMLIQAVPTFHKPKYFADYLGKVNYATNERVLTKIREITSDKPKEEIFMTVTSPGGPSGTGMSFFDHIRYVLKPNLVTIGSGDVDSSGMLIFLSGYKRYVTKHTTGLLHLAGRIFEEGTRFTASDMEAMLKEDRIKDKYYAEVVAQSTDGKLTSASVLELMKKNTILTSEDFIKYGLAEQIIDQAT